MDDVRLRDVRPRTSETIRSLSFEEWIMIFRPLLAPTDKCRDSIPKCDVAEEYLHIETNAADWDVVERADRSARWSLIQDGTDCYIVEGMQETGRVAFLVTEVGWDVDNTFQIDVMTGASVDVSKLDMRPIECFKPCQVVDSYIIRASFWGGKFTHWYCWWCFTTCR